MAYKVGRQDKTHNQKKRYGDQEEQDHLPYTPPVASGMKHTQIQHDAVQEKRKGNENENCLGYSAGLARELF